MKHADPAAVEAFFASAPPRIHLLGDSIARIEGAKFVYVMPGPWTFGEPEPPAVALINDVVRDDSPAGGHAVGPGRFDRRSLKALFREAFHIAIVSGPVSRELYRALPLPLAMGAPLVVIIETSPIQHPKWLRFVQRFSPGVVIEFTSKKGSA